MIAKRSSSSPCSAKIFTMVWANLAKWAVEAITRFLLLENFRETLTATAV